MDCDCTVTTTARVALVCVILRNPTPVVRRVRVENRLAGPLCPPRSEGIPEAGWDETGVSVVVQPHGTRSLGYACPLDSRDDTRAESSQADPPAEVVADERVSEADDHGRSVHAVVQDLGRPAPPRDAVPPPAFGATVASDIEIDDDRHSTANDDDCHTTASTDDCHTIEIDSDSDDTDDADRPTPDDALPRPVTTWLGDVECRIETAERLGPDTSVSTATEAVAEIHCQPADLPARLDADHRTLRALADRIDRLAERAESASVPGDQLRRLS